ncbi:MAG: hypothetical protein WC807_17150 [Hyphomicrobium sp.]|jgi:hypothetical protein
MLSRVVNVLFGNNIGSAADGPKTGVTPNLKTLRSGVSRLGLAAAQAWNGTAVAGQGGAEDLNKLRDEVLANSKAGDRGGAGRRGSELLEMSRIAGSGFTRFMDYAATDGPREGDFEAYVELDVLSGGVPAGTGVLVKDGLQREKRLLTRKALEREIAKACPGSRGAGIGSLALAYLEEAEKELAAARHQWTIAALRLGLLRMVDPIEASWRVPGRGPCFNIVLRDGEVQRSQVLAVYNDGTASGDAVTDLDAGDFAAVMADESLPESLRKEAEYVLARLEGVRPVESAHPDRVKMIRVMEDPRGRIEQFETPDGIREWYMGGKLIYADDWGRPADRSYYEQARSRGVEVDLEP